MNVKEAYNDWAKQYDTNENKTRDLEAVALRSILSSLSFNRCLEIGCGTGKNTSWLLTRAKELTAVDLSEEMLALARKKIRHEQVHFIQADITKEWDFLNGKFDLATFSLVLEHIEDLGSVFRKLTDKLHPGAFVYVGELHPFRQYTGSKARYETEEGTKVVSCFTHHISEFVRAAKANGLSLVDLHEYFDGNEKNALPRILTLLLQKP